MNNLNDSDLPEFRQPSLAQLIDQEMANEMDLHFGYGQRISDREADEMAARHDQIMAMLDAFDRGQVKLGERLDADKLMIADMIRDAREVA